MLIFPPHKISVRYAILPLEIARLTLFSSNCAKNPQVHFTTTLFALIRDNLGINVRESSEMDQVRLTPAAKKKLTWHFFEKDTNRHWHAHRCCSNATTRNREQVKNPQVFQNKIRRETGLV